MGGQQQSEARSTLARAKRVLQIVGLADRANDNAKTLPYAQQRLSRSHARWRRAEVSVLCSTKPAAGMNMTESMT